ncbi:type IV pilus biogenesis/stability protein PilW [Marinobacter sp. X15-166B]|nr:type IV pilus biogenesis/stability protein PilW [Marinobacter sp. X15-166B]
MLFGYLVVAILAGCVTTTNSRFAKEADKDKAVANYVQLATAYVGQGNVERARDHLDRAMELDPRNAGAHAAMGLIYQYEREPELAEAALARSLRLDPGYTRGRVFYGALLYGQGRFAEARDAFAVAARDTGYKDRASVFYNLGLTEEQLHNSPAAAVAYRRSVELSRGDPASLLALARVSIDNEEYELAARYYQRLLDRMQRDPSMSHSADSLLVGIKIARHYDDYNRVSSLALLLRDRFPDSDQYKQYKVLTSHGQ